MLAWGQQPFRMSSEWWCAPCQKMEDQQASAASFLLDVPKNDTHLVVILFFKNSKNWNRAGRKIMGALRNLGSTATKFKPRCVAPSLKQRQPSLIFEARVGNHLNQLRGNLDQL